MTAIHTTPVAVHPNAELIRAIANGKTVECWIDGWGADEWMPIDAASTTAAEQLLFPHRWRCQMYQFRLGHMNPIHAEWKNSQLERWRKTGHEMNTLIAPELRGASEPAHANYATTKTGIVIGGSWIPRHSADYANPISYSRRAGMFARWLHAQRDAAVAIAVAVGIFTVALSIGYVDAPIDAQADALVAGLGRK